MAFINVKKVVLESKDDVVQSFGDVVLLCASVTHDHLEKKEFNEALHQLGMLKCSVESLEYLLVTNKKKEDAKKDAEAYGEAIMKLDYHSKSNG